MDECARGLVDQRLGGSESGSAKVQLRRSRVQKCKSGCKWGVGDLGRGATASRPFEAETVKSSGLS